MYLDAQGKGVNGLFRVLRRVFVIRGGEDILHGDFPHPDFILGNRVMRLCRGNNGFWRRLRNRFLFFRLRPPGRLCRPVLLCGLFPANGLPRIGNRPGPAHGGEYFLYRLIRRPFFNLCERFIRFLIEPPRGLRVFLETDAEEAHLRKLIAGKRASLFHCLRQPDIRLQRAFPDQGARQVHHAERILRAPVSLVGFIKTKRERLLSVRNTGGRRLSLRERFQFIPRADVLGFRVILPRVRLIFKRLYCREIRLLSLCF